MACYCTVQYSTGCTWATLRQRSLGGCVQHGSAPGFLGSAPVTGCTLDRQPALLGRLALARRYCCAGSLVTGVGRCFWDQRGPKVTAGVQSLTTLSCIILYVLGGRRGGVTACCCRCSTGCTAQHGTVQHSCDRDVTVSHYFAAHSVAGSAGESRR